jgi:hypothetical protein
MIGPSIPNTPSECVEQPSLHWRFLHMRVPFIVIPLLLTGCATYGEIVDREPFKTEMVQAAAQPLRDCVLDKLRRNEPGWTYTSSALGGTEHISADADFGTRSASYGWDLAFIPGNNAATRVEARTRKTVWGNPVYPTDLWATIMNCASTRAAGASSRVYT